LTLNILTLEDIEEVEEVEEMGALVSVLRVPQCQFSWIDILERARRVFQDTLYFAGWAKKILSATFHYQEEESVTPGCGSVIRRLQLVACVISFLKAFPFHSFLA
jgi:hypothetical protein